MTSPSTLMKGTAITCLASMVLVVTVTLLSEELLFDPYRLMHLLAFQPTELWLKTIGIAFLGSAAALLFGGETKPRTAGMAIACCLVPIGATLFTLGAASLGAINAGGVTTIAYSLLAIATLSFTGFVSVALVFAYRNSRFLTSQLSAVLTRLRSRG